MKIIPLILVLIISSFILISTSFAATKHFDVTPPSGDNYSVVAADYCGDPSECANSDNPDNCGLAACADGQAWTKYELTCVEYTNPFNDEVSYGSYYQQGGIVYSIGDKCYDGEYGLRSSSCFNEPSPSMYKTCCSYGSPSYVNPDSCVQFAGDNTNPPWEGSCPAGYTREVFCGFNGVPCGQPACGDLPVPTDPPAPLTDVYYCSGDSIRHKKSDGSDDYLYCNCDPGSSIADCQGNACRIKASDTNDAECYTSSCSYGTWSSWTNSSCCGNGLRGETRTRSVISGAGCTATSEAQCVKADSSCNTAPPPPPPGCDASQVNMSVTPNPVNIGTNNITFNVSGTQGSTNIGDTWSGGVNCSGGFWGSKTCSATSAVNNASWTHTWQVWNGSSWSGTCSKSINYTVNSNVPPTPTISSMPGCIISGYDGSGITISWSTTTPAVNYIDISTNSSFSTFYNKQIPSGTSTSAKDFGKNNGYWNGSSWSSNALFFQADTPYYVRSYNGSLNSNPPHGFFRTPFICLTTSCSVAPASIIVSDPAAWWTAAPLGGTSSYTYTWSGTDGLSGNTQAVNKTYTTAGTKTGQVTVNSGTQTATANCSNSLTVTSPPCPPSSGYPAGGLGSCGSISTRADGQPDLNTIAACDGIWKYNPGTATAPLAYNNWCAANLNSVRAYCYACDPNAVTPWIQTTGDVHSNTGINASGGP